MLSGYNSDKANLNLAPRAFLTLAAMGVFIAIIAIRLWYLQVVRGDIFREKSENNRLQTLFVPPPRGLIEDRHGKVLVSNRPAFNIELVTEDTPDEKQSVRTLAHVLGIDEAPLIQQLRNQRKRRKFESKLLLPDVSRDVIAKVEAKRYLLPGVVIRVVPARNYVYGDLAAHLIGYIREITQKQLDSAQYDGRYMKGDLVGQSGIEAKWEPYLQGSRGRQRVIVNATGTKVGELVSEGEVLGSTIRLTIGLASQQAADKALSDKEGAIVAMDPNTGEVLALSSSHRFDPNVFTRGLTPEDWRDLIQDKKLHNKAIQGGYPPGSVYKVFTSFAVLAEGLMKTEEKVFCGGGLHFAGREYKCHKKTGHGSVSLLPALEQSCDVYYYTAGQKLGIDRIHKWLSDFGFDELTGLGLPEESKGLIPSQEWKRRAFKNPGDKKWYAGETLSVAIGQGANMVTPLQVTRGISAIVNGGKVLEPRIVNLVRASDGRLIEEFKTPKIVREIKADIKVFNTVRKAMEDVVNGPRGTGKRSQLPAPFNIKVGGKTGTAQVVSLKHGTKGDFNDHAWFVGYAPIEDPKIVVTALIENGGHGGEVAAPAVRQVMEAFFDPTGEIRASLTPTPTPTNVNKAKPNGSNPTSSSEVKPATPTPSPVPQSLENQDGAISADAQALRLDDEDE